MIRIGIISDTHGLVHPRVPELFANVDAIVHAGDVGGEHVLRALRALAPLTYVDGNNDDASGEDILRTTIAGVRILLTHILPHPHRPSPRVVASLRELPADLVVFGHSHMPHDEVIHGVRYFNPGSAGRRRFRNPVAAGLLEKRGRAWTVMHVRLDDD
jgi:putative phosphoesterase